MKKILNETKADSIAVYNALDIVSGGSLSLIKQNITQTFHGFLEAKFNNLVEDIISDGMSEEKLLEFINSHTSNERDFIANLILKNMNADNQISTFLLAKLWTQKIRNGSLNYYEASLFTNVNTLTFQDYEVFYNSFCNISLYPSKHQSIFQTTTLSENKHYLTSLNKYKNIGIITDAELFDGGSIIEENNLKINFLKTPFSDTFFGYLQEFFQRH